MSQVFGKYRLERRIAVGGMAEIFLATHAGPEGFRKKVAIKRVLAPFAQNEHFVTMFLDEARLAARFSHPNIVQIFDLGEVHGEYYLAMEYVHGASLSMLLKACSQTQVKIPAEIAVKTISMACEGLHYAHNFADEDGVPLNLIHRDISPQNIMLSYTGAVKLLDFGVAKAAINVYRTQATSMKGKIAYMSPEQISQKAPLDHRSDIFSLGCVLFELLSGARPFPGESELEMMRAIVDSPPQDIRRLTPEIPELLVPVLLRSLEKDREARYGSARELRNELEQFLVTQPAMVDSYALGDFLARQMPPADASPGKAPPEGLQRVLSPPMEAVQEAASLDVQAAVAAGAEQSERTHPEKPSAARPADSSGDIDRAFEEDPTPPDTTSPSLEAERAPRRSWSRSWLFLGIASTVFIATAAAYVNTMMDDTPAPSSPPVDALEPAPLAPAGSHEALAKAAEDPAPDRRKKRPPAAKRRRRNTGNRSQEQVDQLQASAEKLMQSTIANQPKPAGKDEQAGADRPAPPKPAAEDPPLAEDPGSVSKVDGLFKVKKAVSLRRASQAAMQKKQYRKAIQMLNQAVKLNPKDHELFRLMAEAYEQTGHKDLAAVLYQRYITICPKCSKVDQVRKKLEAYR
ncbi:MAG: protein kinase [Deltaproteobacteria bacterium]|nr:protein kinase [Deltaproteobacteria bacterium]